MNKKWIIPIAIVLVALFALIVAVSDDSSVTGSGETQTFNVSAGSCELSDFINDVKTLPYYEGYDAETVKWMESLGNKQVFRGNDSIVIMNGDDARKVLPDPGTTDAYIYDYFTAEVIETHDLGDGYPTVYYVKNVDFINQEIIGNGLA